MNQRWLIDCLKRTDKEKGRTREREKETERETERCAPPRTEITEGHCARKPFGEEVRKHVIERPWNQATLVGLRHVAPHGVRLPTTSHTIRENGAVIPLQELRQHTLFGKPTKTSSCDEVSPNTRSNIKRVARLCRRVQHKHLICVLHDQATVQPHTHTHTHTHTYILTHKHTHTRKSTSA